MTRGGGGGGDPLMQRCTFLYVHVCVYLIIIKQDRILYNVVAGFIITYTAHFYSYDGANQIGVHNALLIFLIRYCVYKTFLVTQ